MRLRLVWTDAAVQAVASGFWWRTPALSNRASVQWIVAEPPTEGLVPGVAVTAGGGHTPNAVGLAVGVVRAGGVVWAMGPALRTEPVGLSDFGPPPPEDATVSANTAAIAKTAPARLSSGLRARRLTEESVEEAAFCSMNDAHMGRERARL